MHRRKKRTQEQVEKAERARHALDLSLQGFDYATIGEQLQVSKATAWRIIQKEIARIPTASAENAKKVALAKLDREWRRTDRVLERLDQAFDESENLKGLEGLEKLTLAISRVQLTRIRIEQRRAALEGTDAPRPQPIVQVNMAAPERPNFKALNDHELRELRRIQLKMLAASDDNAITVQAEDDHGERDQVERGGPG